MFGGGHTHLSLGCIWRYKKCDVKLTKVASILRRYFDFVEPDHKEAGTSVN